MFMLIEHKLKLELLEHIIIPHACLASALSCNLDEIFMLSTTSFTYMYKVSHVHEQKYMHNA